MPIELFTNPTKLIILGRCGHPEHFGSGACFCKNLSLAEKKFRSYEDMLMRKLITQKII
jgi:hypothetical protein